MEVWIYLSIFINFIYFESTIAAIEDIDFNYTATKDSYDKLFQDGIKLYHEKNWSEAIHVLELCEADYRHENVVKGNCRLKCQKDIEKATSLKQHKYNQELIYHYYWIKLRKCSEKCSRNFLGRRGIVSPKIKSAFEKREPYDYLQFSYFMIKQYTKAANAAFTYLEVNNNNTIMLDNLKYYKSKINNDFIIKSMEETPYSRSLIKGINSYLEGKYKDCIHYMEESVILYIKVYNICLALCEDYHERSQTSSILSKYYDTVLECQLNCRGDMAVHDEKLIKYNLEDIYNFLQFSYYQEEDYSAAAACTKSFLVIKPKDVVMEDNLDFYISNYKVGPVKERPEARRYVDEQLFRKRLLLLNMESSYVENFMEESTTDDMISIDEDDDGLSTDFAGQNSTLNWKDLAELKSINVVYDNLMLNGTQRVVADNAATEEDCNRLMNVIEKMAKKGDGYNNKENPDRPFTLKESFEGVNVMAASVGASNGIVEVDDAKLYLDLSERVRQFTESYFNLTSKLYFAFTHLVCRTSVDASGDSEITETYFSHPVHADNCLFGADGPETCPKRPPAYTWRDYSAILYLNNDFEGGEFIFADKRNEIEASVTPKCGRLVAFSAGFENLHGVLGVSKGRRCALPIWFTLSGQNSETQRYFAEKLLKQVKDDVKEERKNNKRSEKEKMSLQNSNSRTEL